MDRMAHRQTGNGLTGRCSAWLSSSLEERQRLFGNVLLQIGIPVKPDASVFRAVFYAAIALFRHAVHQLGYDFQVIYLTDDVYLFHD
jgi:hypothetical protein